MIDERWHAALTGPVGGRPVDLDAVRRDGHNRLRRLVGTRLAMIGAIGVLLVGGGLAAIAPDDEDIEVVVPDVVGTPVADATIALADAGFEVVTRLVDSDAVPPGVVVAQEPSGGTVVASGARVTIDVATDTQTSDDDPGNDGDDTDSDDTDDDPGDEVEVPDVVGMQLDDALDALLDRDLTFEVRQVETAEFPEGTVVEQDPSAGTRVAVGSRVTVDVASPPPLRRSVIAWILSLGPSAPPGPVQEGAAYDLLLDPGGCDELARILDADELALSSTSHRLYRGAAAACLAAFHDQPREWPVAEAALAGTSAGDVATCIDIATLGLLQRLVTAHRDDPEAEFEKASGGPSEAAPCPVITGLVPASVQPGVATDVTIDGSNLERVVEVAIYSFYEDDDFEVHEVQTAGRPLVVTIQVPTTAASACVVVRENSNWNAAGARLQVEGSDATPGACPPPSPE